MENTQLVPMSKYDKRNADRRVLAAKCIADPSDYESLEKLFVLVHPLANRIVHGYSLRIPALSNEDYMQLADITVWRVLNRIRVVPDILNNFEAYLMAAIRNNYAAEFRKYVFKSFVEISSFNRPGSPLTVSNLQFLERYVQNIVEKNNATRRAFRANHLELCRQRDREYWSRNKNKKREKDQRYREKHKDKIAAQHKAYRATHMEQHIASNAKYRENHREEIRERSRAYYWNNLEYFKDYYETHREERRQSRRNHYIENRERLLAKSREYKRKKRAEENRKRESEEQAEKPFLLSQEKP